MTAVLSTPIDRRGESRRGARLVVGIVAVYWTVHTIRSDSKERVMSESASPSVAPRAESVEDILHLVRTRVLLVAMNVLAIAMLIVCVFLARQAFVTDTLTPTTAALCSWGLVFPVLRLFRSRMTFRTSALVLMSVMLLSAAMVAVRGGLTIGNLGWVVGSPPGFVRASGRRAAGGGAAGDGRRKAVRIVGSVGAKPLRAVHIAVILPIHRVGQAYLFEIVETGRGLRPGFGAGESREEHRGENGDDGDDHQKFDQSKASRFSHGRYICRNITMRRKC